jgi:hypothetical protein
MGFFTCSNSFLYDYIVFFKIFIFSDKYTIQIIYLHTINVISKYLKFFVVFFLHPVSIEISVDVFIAKLRSPKATGHDENQRDKYARLASHLREGVDEQLWLPGLFGCHSRDLYANRHDFFVLERFQQLFSRYLHFFLTHPVELLLASLCQQGVEWLLGLYGSDPSLRAEVSDLLCRLEEVL